MARTAGTEARAEPGAEAAPAGDDERGRRLRLPRTTVPRLLAGIATVVGLVCWELSARYGWIDPLFTSSPSEVWSAAGELLLDPRFQTGVLETLREFFVGFAVSAAGGIVFGLMAGWYWQVREFTAPFVAAMYATPRIAVLPLFVLWFGVGSWSRIAFIVSLAGLPVFINTADAIRVVEPGLIRVARNFGASQIQVFRTVAIPAAVPQIVSGLRVAVSFSILAAVTAQFFIGGEGIGYLLKQYGNAFQTAKLMVAVIAAALLGVVALVPLNWLERRFEFWRPAR